MLVLAFVALLPRFLLGFFLVRWIWKSADVPSLMLQLMLAAPVGIGISSLNSFLWIWAQLDLHTYAIGEAIAALVVVALRVWRRKHLFPWRIENLREFLAKQQTTWLVILGLGIAVLLAGFLSDSILWPHGRWDAWWNWNVVARFVYRGGEHWTGTFLRSYDHPDYPLLLAMTNATTWELLRTETTRGPIALAFVFTMCTAGLVYGLLLKVRDTHQAILAAVVLITQPLVIHVASSQYADLPEACYFLASAGLMLVYLVSEEKPIALIAGLTAGLAAWTKNEGIPFLLVSLLAWACICWPRQKPAMGYFLAGLAYPLLVLTGFKIFLAPRNDLVGGLQNSLAWLTEVPRYTYLIEHAAVALWNVGEGPISVIAILLVYAAVMGKTGFPVRGLRQVVSIIFAQLLIYLSIYLIASNDLAWQISSSIDRLYLHLFPLMILSVFLWLKSPKESTAQRQTVRNAVVGVDEARRTAPP